LLAAARGHKPIPSIATIQDMKSPTLVRIASETLQELVQRSLSEVRAESFELSIYFGKNLAKKHEKLAWELYKSFHAPLLRAKFVRREEQWSLSAVGPIALKDVPNSHQAALVEFAKEYFNKRAPSSRAKAARFSLAILRNPQEEMPPSNEKALQKFIKAAQRASLEAELITVSDLRRLAEFDALFIRETTAVNHHTFRFAQKAKAHGLVVIDDPDSILKCTNKVYLAELLERFDLPAPATFLVHKGNAEEMLSQLPIPCVLKQPDSAFSHGVVRTDTREEARKAIEHLLRSSDLILAQEYLPTAFDWRVGVIDGTPLYACKYHMARSHWQIYKHQGPGKVLTGKHETFSVDMVEQKLLRVAVKAANLIGNGFYGIDIKEHHGKYRIIEVNDNPSIDAGVEDKVLKDRLYDAIMQVFLRRLTAKSEGRLYE
jgi:glutathione synthase/RimK-type ligase-like ATP-grasp enzyme